jgi:EpsI family protein
MVSVAAVVLALLGPGYAAGLDSGFTAASVPAISTSQVAPPWRAVGDGGTGWRPVVIGANQVRLDGFEKPGSGVVVRFVALYRLRTVGNALTRSDNRIADDRIWQLAHRGHAEIALDGQELAVVSDRIESGPHRRLVWSFYIVDGKIVAGLLEAKLLQARALLLRRAPLGAFVAVSASEDDPDRPAPAQLNAFLRADAPLLHFLMKASRGSVAGDGVAGDGAGQASHWD